MCSKENYNNIIILTFHVICVFLKNACAICIFFHELGWAVIIVNHMVMLNAPRL